MALQRSSRFNIEFFGNPAASNRIKTLATDPFYLFSSDHPLALMLPEALNTTEYGSKIGIAISDMNFIVLAGVAHSENAKILDQIGEMIFKCPQDRFECMLATPPTAATKVTEFLIEGPAHNALLELDGYIDRIIKDVDDAQR
eukprot:jgi/Chrpa1/27305/Chrysochromulina_OHIO_Genome00026802-RA